MTGNLLMLMRKRGSYQESLLSTSPACCIPFTDTTGTVATDVSGNGAHGTYRESAGAYAVSNWTQDGTFLDGSTVPRFGTYDDGGGEEQHLVDMIVVDNGFKSCADWDEFSIMVWIKVRVSTVWTDSTLRVPWRLQAANGPGGLNYHWHNKTATNNQMQSRSWVNGNTSPNITHTGIDTTDWFQSLVTVSRSANEYEWFINNIQVGATDTVADDFSQTNLNLALVGAASTAGGSPWDGYLAYFTVWNKILSTTERATIQPYAVSYDPTP